MIHQQSCVCRIGAQVVHLLLSMVRKGVGTMLIHLSEAQTTPMPRTGEIHEMKPNKTGETAIHLEVYSSIHTVYLPTRGHKASTRDTTIQHDTAIHLYNAIQCIGCITTPQSTSSRRSDAREDALRPCLTYRTLLPTTLADTDLLAADA